MCRAKTAVAPSACAGQWRTAWDGGFFGEEAAQPTAPYLGCALTSPWFDSSEGRPGQWPTASVDRFQEATWEPARTKIQKRA
eukprot:3250943-Alexandrium_andersonii.AAC.1